MSVKFGLTERFQCIETLLRFPSYLFLNIESENGNKCTKSHRKNDGLIEKNEKKSRYS